eukprot:m.290606 g.290606  ORF g.290606 m.290606 type:complete len:138 (+) comp55082_c0_seq7:876-1289(+)
MVRDFSFDNDEVMNADETGVMLGHSPRYVYVDATTTHAAVPPSDEKSRFTALLWSTGAGDMGPPFLIVKCSTNAANLSNSTVLDHVAKHTAFKYWTKHLWSRTLELNVRGKSTVIKFTRTYLSHPETKAIVTVQFRA